MDKMVCKCESVDSSNSSKKYAFRREGEGGFSGNNPIFSHQHYTAIANVLKKFENHGGEVLNQLVWMFEEDNTKFDRDRFIAFIEGKGKN